MKGITLIFFVVLLALPLRAIDVREVGSLIDNSGNGAQIISQDGAYSIPTETGTLWLYGDTFYGHGEIEGAVSNTTAWSQDNDAKDGLRLTARVTDAGIPAPLFAYQKSEDPDTLRLWPGHGIVVNGKVYVFYSVTKALTHVEQGVAVSTNPRTSFIRLRWKGRSGYWGKTEPRMGTAVMQGNDGWVYVYGRYEAPPNGLVIARVKPTMLPQLDQYEYFCVGRDGPRWSKSIQKACPPFNEAPPEASVSFHSFLGKYLMLYNRYLEQDVVIRTAKNPWGPWSSPAPILKCPQSKNPPQGISCYAAKEHPQYAKAAERKIYFTLVDGRVYGGRPDLFEAKFSTREP